MCVMKGLRALCGGLEDNVSITKPWVGLRKKDSLLSVWALLAVSCGALNAKAL